MNWKNEAIDRLSRYRAMTQAVENIPKELTRLERSIQELRGCDPAKTPSAKNPGPRDDVLIGNIIKRQELCDSYENAKIWVDTTDQAMSVLNSEEKTILTRMYVTPERGVVDQLCFDLGVEQSSIYRKRDQALYRFTMALYGTA